MNEIKCPNCKTVFQINETDYSKIVKQIRDKEFENELQFREIQYKESKEAAIKVTRAELEKELATKLNEKDLKINNLKSDLEKIEKETANDLEKKYKEELNKNKIEIVNLKNNINSLSKEKELSLKNLQNEYEKNAIKKLNEKDNEIVKLQNEIKNIAEKTKNELEKNFSTQLNESKNEVNDLKNKIKLLDSENALALKNALVEKENEIFSLTTKIESSKNEFLLKEKSIKDSYEEKLKSKDEQIAYYKDFKARQSTKMIGESLEQHCNVEFNRIRPLFNNAYFEKDNNCKSGSKGDFIFRDFDEDGIEITSIMFEMKNEADETASKHKNEDFFKELDKDRKEKNCEYAVLVSLLEIDNEFYNTGIVDVSHRYPKMYVIRPQFFIPLITLIRNLALNSLKYKKELKILENQNIDIAHFEEKMTSFKDAFGRNYRLASEKFKKAIDEIDKTIDHLQKTKDALLSSENNLRLANNKAEDLTIKKLTSNSPSIALMFEELSNQEVS